MKLIDLKKGPQNLQKFFEKPLPPSPRKVSEHATAES